MARKLCSIISLSFLLLVVLVFSSTCYAGVSVEILSAPPSASAGETINITAKISSDENVNVNGSVYSYIYIYDQNTKATSYANNKGWSENSHGFEIGAGESKTISLTNIIKKNVTSGEYTYRIRFKGSNKKDYDDDRNITISAQTYQQLTCEAEFIGEYCKSGAIYQKYRQNNCSQIEKKIETCAFGCDGRVCKNSTNSTDKTIISNATTSNSTTTNYSANSTTNNTNNTLASNNTNSNNQTSNNRTTNASEQHLAEQKTTQEAPLPLDQPTESDKPLVDIHQISALFLLEKNLSLIGLIVLLAVVGVILWKI